MSTRVKATPYARKQAARAGIDLALLRGSGPGGRVVAADVDRARRLPTTTEAAPKGAFTDHEPGRTRVAVAKAMSAAASVPQFTLSVDVDATPLLGFRDNRRAASSDAPRVSVTHMVVRACGVMLRQHPALNASWIEGRIRRYDNGNVAVAVALDDGVVAPVIPRCDELDLDGLVEAVGAAVARAESGRLLPSDLAPAAMTVSNLGMYGIDAFQAVVTPPQGSVLAVGRVRDEPVVRDGHVVAGQRMNLGLTVDHRVTDGAQAARALGHLRQLLEQPSALMGS